MSLSRSFVSAKTPLKRRFSDVPNYSRIFGPDSASVKQAFPCR